MHTPFLSGNNLMKMFFTEGEVTAVQAELAVLREHGHKLMLVGEMVASYRKEQLHSLRQLERHAAWLRTKVLIGDTMGREKAQDWGACS